MKHITKRIISLLASVVTAISSMTLSCSNAFAEELANSSASASSANTEVKTGGFLSELFPDELEQSVKGNEEAQKKEYVIYKMEYDHNNENLIVEYSAKDNCTIFIGFYNDEGTELYTSLNEKVTAGINQSIFIPKPEGLPRYHLIRAYMIGYLQEPLSVPYENKESTKVIQDIIEKKPSDFDDDKVILVDENDDYNFIVTKNEHAIIYSDDTKDTFVGINQDTDEMYFENIDKIKELRSNQDVLIYLPDDMLYFRVCDVEIDGTKAIVTKQFLDARDLIEFIKFDSSEYTGEVTYSVEDSEYSEDIEIVDNASNSSLQDTTGRQPAPFINIDDTLSKTFRVNLASMSLKTREKDKDLTAELKGGASAELTPSLNIKIYLDVGELYLSAGYKFEVVFKVEAEYRTTIKIPGLKIGTLVVNFSIIPTINLYVRAGMEVKLTKETVISYDLFEGLQYTQKELEVEQPSGYVEFELTIGLDSGINLVDEKLLRLSVEPEIGVRLHREKALNQKQEYVWHRCDDCINQSLTLFTKLSFNLRVFNHNVFGDTDDEDDYKPFEVEAIGSEYEAEADLKNEEWHITNGIKYDGPCDNISHKVIFKVYDITGNASDIKGKPVSGAKLYIKTGNRSFSSLENDFGDAVETNSSGVAEAWIDDKILTDETCVVLAQSSNDKKGQVFVGKCIDLSLDHANSFDILLDNDVDDNPSPSTSDKGYCGYDENVYEEIIVNTEQYDTKNHCIIHDDGTIEELPTWTTWNYYNNDKKSGRVAVRVHTPTKDVKYSISSSSCKVEGSGELFTEYLLKKIRESGGKVTTLIIDANIKVNNLSDYPCNEYWFSSSDDELYGAGILRNNQNVKRVNMFGFSKINSNFFLGCTNLSEIDFGQAITTIESGAFAGTKIEKLDCPNTLKSIGSGAFQGCTKLKEVYFDYGLDSIGDSAFAGCINLKEVTFSKCLQSIGSSAFVGCINLKDVKFSSNGKLSSIGNTAFQGTPIKSIEIPGSVSKIDYSAFKDCKNLSKVTINEGLHTIESCAFYNTPITSINLPSSVKIIENGAFDNCSKLKTVIINGDIETIEIGAFGYGTNGFYSLNTIIFNNGVTEIPEGAFKDIKTLSNIRFSDNLKTINKEAFSECDLLTSIYLPDSLEYIEDEAFYDCNSLKSIVLSKNLKRIGNKAFYHNESLKSIVIPEDVEEVGESAFESSKLKSVIIPASVSKIDKKAFDMACYTYKKDQKGTLTDIYIYNPECELVEGFIEHDDTYKVTLHGYKDSTAYKYYEEFKDFVNFEELKSEQPVPTTTTTTATTTVVKTVTTKATTIVTTNVSPNSECVMIAVNGIEVNEDTPSKELLDNRNLRHFDQQTADNDGIASFSYVPNENEKWTFLFVNEAINNMVDRSVGAINDLKTSSESTITGDANGDGEIDMSDAVLIMQALANPNKYGLNGTAAIHLTARGFKYGDVEENGNGITANDALQIQKYLLGKIDSLK